MGDIVNLQGPVSLSQEGPEKTSIRSFGNVIIPTKNFEPSREQLELLNRGLTFIPTIKLEKHQKEQTQLDLQNYHRRIKLAVYYQEDDDSSLEIDITPFTQKSQWTPPNNKLPKQVELLVAKDTDNFQKNLKYYKKKKPNTRQGKST